MRRSLVAKQEGAAADKCQINLAISSSGTWTQRELVCHGVDMCVRSVHTVGANSTWSAPREIALFNSSFNLAFVSPPKRHEPPLCVQLGPKRNLFDRMQHTLTTASDLISQLGVKAPQHVVNQIASAIRENDLEAATEWERVGFEIEASLKRKG